MNVFWLDNDEDELMAGCDCGWRGNWRDTLRAAYDDATEHLAKCHPDAEEAS